jgi:transcriptional regulator with XRE-family HTH domain
MTVLGRILQLRNERNWTEYRLAEESGIAQTTISSWFKKNVSPSISSLENLCNAFNITMSQFFAYGNTPIPLTDKQKLLLDNWNKLPKNQQNIVLDLLKSM